jgi:hypothetical protein
MEFVLLLCCNGGVAGHATITTNAGGVAVDPRHRAVRLVACGTTPLSLSQAPLHVRTVSAGLLFQVSFVCGPSIKRKNNQHFDFANNVLTSANLMTY